MKTNVLMKARRATVKSLVSLKAWMLLCLVMLCAAGVRAQTPYAIWCEGNSTLYFTNSNVTFAAGEPFYDQTITRVWYGDAVTNVGDSEAPQWIATVAPSCTKVVFYQNFSEVKPTSLNSWFRGMKNLTEIEGLQYLNTSEATNMRRMFEDCQSLTSLDLSSFDTQKVTSMQSMFAYCSGLTSLDLSSFDTQKVTSMLSMFAYCSGLTSLDLSSFNTKEVTVMSLMFRGCEKLTSLDLSNFNTAKVTNMTSMFQGCSSLESLDLNDFKTDALEAMNFMFSDCQQLKTIYCNNDWDTSKVPEDFKDKVFSNCTNLVGGYGTAYADSHVGYEYARIDREGTPGYFTQMAYALWLENNSLVFTCMNDKFSEDGTKYDGQTITNVWSGDDVTNYGDQPQWNIFVVGINCTKVVFDQSFREVKLTSLKRWFARLYNPALQFVGLENLNTSEVTDMSMMFEDCQRLTSLDLSSFDTQKVTTMKGMFKDCIALTTIDLSSFNTENVTDMSQMFYNCHDLTSLDLSHFNTQKVTDMTRMFSDCWALTDLDLGSFNTENVTSMYYMFCDCRVLANLNVSSFNTENVTDMTYMFSGCYKLPSLDLSHFDTGKVTSMLCMFYASNNLTSLDLSNFKTDKVETINSMFSGCKNLKTIFCNNDWNTENVTDVGRSIFYGCTSLVGGNGTAYDEGHIDKEYARIDREGAPGYFKEKGTPYAIWCEGNTTLYFTNSTETYAASGTYDGQTITNIWSGDEVTNYGDQPQWSSVGNSCTKVVFDQSFSEVKLTSLKRWFAGLNAPAIQFVGLENLNTSEVTDMSYMFEATNKLENIDLSSLNTGKVTTMKGMFKDCLALTTIDLSSFNTENVTDMSQMFYNCHDLTSLDLSHFNTQKVTDMTRMFSDCWALTDLDLGSFNTENVTSMYYMFCDCRVLANLNVSSFNTENVTDMTYMFSGCYKLPSLDLSHFDTGKVTSMLCMFYASNNLTSLDLSNFKTDKVETINSMFSGCKNLKTIFCNNDWNTENVTDVGRSIFYGCTSLVGGNGTAYDEGHIDKEYARIDREGTPGYFTSTFEYTISSAMVGTLYMDYAVNIPEADYFDAYYVKSINSEGTLYLKKVKDVIPANTGVIIFGNEGTYKMMQNSKEVPAINDNLLCGVTKATSVASLKAQHGKDIYVLSRGKDSYINFLKAGSGVKSIPANRAYLPYSSASGAKELSIVFDEEGSEATGIDNVATEKAERMGVYNLSGQRVAKPQHGIYIVNGKKVFIP